MPSELLTVQILSPAKPLAYVKAKRLQAPGLLGELGILPGHTPLISELKPGILEVVTENEGKNLLYFVAGGYLEVQNNELLVLLELAEAPEEVDLSRAQEAEKRAVKRLEDASHEDINIARALLALERAKARQQLVTLSKGPGTDRARAHD